MSAGRICVRAVQVVSPAESGRDAARHMRETGVGALVVLDEKRRPIGLVSDRDLVLHCVAEGRDPDATPVSALMGAVHCIDESTPIEEALQRMGGLGTRRLAVTDAQGRLAGILALDDVLELLAEESESIGRLLRRRPPSARN